MDNTQNRTSEAYNRYMELRQPIEYFLLNLKAGDIELEELESMVSNFEDFRNVCEYLIKNR